VLLSPKRGLFGAGETRVRRDFGELALLKPHELKIKRNITIFEPSSEVLEVQSYHFRPSRILRFFFLSLWKTLSTLYVELEQTFSRQHIITSPPSPILV
jgi:hypothetical protein